MSLVFLASVDLWNENEGLRQISLIFPAVNCLIMDCAPTLIDFHCRLEIHWGRDPMSKKFHASPGAGQNGPSFKGGLEPGEVDFGSSRFMELRRGNSAPLIRQYCCPDTRDCLHSGPSSRAAR